MQIDEQKQKAYFNMHDNQYDPQLIMNPPAHTAQELQLLLDILKKHTTSGEIADFGAGSGRLTIPLLKNGYSVYSIDISDESLGNLQKLATEQSLPLPHTSHEFPTGKKFKAIVGTDILHHVNFDEYFPKLYEALEPGGKIIFSEPNAFNISWYIYLPIIADWEVEKGVMDCSIFNFTKKLKEAGFRTIYLRGLGLIPRPLFNFSPQLVTINDKIGDMPILKLFAYRYIVEATK